MRRVVVVGSSGSGKTTVARAVAETLGHPYLELDWVMHSGGWDSARGEPFRHEVAEFAQGDHWVIDGDYTSQGTPEVVWPRADTVIWLDLPRWRIMRRVTVRTLRRIVSREKLWAGVQEPWTNLYSLDPYRNIMVWAWTRHAHVREKYETALAQGAWDHTKVHRLRSPAEVGSFLALLRSTSRM